MNVGKGITIEETEDLITITFRKDGDFGLSTSGKNTIVASTGGNIQLPSGVYIGVNAYRR